MDDEREAFRAAAARVAALIESMPDPDRRPAESEWTVRDVAVHLALVAEFYGDFATGGTEPFVDVSDVAGGSVARSSAIRLAAEPEQDLRALAGRVRAGADRLLAVTQGRDGDEPVVWNGLPMALRGLFALGVGEMLLHGRDLAAMTRTPWPIDADDARMVLAAALSVLPLFANPRTTAGVHARYDLRVRGGTRATVRIDDGTITTEPPGAPVDCHVSAEPVALLLVSYGRLPQWIPALTGRLLAWGRKPWLGLRLTSYLVAP